MADVRFSCGRDFHCVPDISAALSSACQSGFDFVCAPICHPRYSREFQDPVPNRTNAFTRSDMVLTSSDWSSLVVGKVSGWIDMDSPNKAVRYNSEKALRQEISYAVHLSLPAVQVRLKSFNCMNLARHINHIIMSTNVQQIWFQVPMVCPKEYCDPNLFEEKEECRLSKKEADPWEWWNLIRIICANHRKAGLALELSAVLPSEEEIKRWCGEPIKAVLIPTSIFLVNKRGFPVLSRAHQAFVRQLFKLDVQFVLTGTNKFKEKGVEFYHQYLEHLHKTQPELDNVSQFAKGYEDYLQCPLQPLMDNLESQTYEIFEKDPVKYSQYQKAIFQALVDRVPEDKKDSVVTVLMVVGAGRGPLVRASLAAAREADRKVRVYAVEKNPNAVVTLEALKEEEWGEKVTVVSCDMRMWEAPEKADIVVSELLGSFGDNELSPECLDGAQRFLKDDSISIPCEYTSYVTPMSARKLHFEVSQNKETNKGPQAPFETPYVVRLQNVHLVGPPLPCFTFKHPNKGKVDNSRYKILSFHADSSCLVHGFAGYFDTVLYGNVTLSIVPETHSEGMFSWFPIYFPIQNPVYVEKGQTVTFHVWRLCSPSNVWYEWCMSEPVPVPVHNPGGRSYLIGL